MPILNNRDLSRVKYGKANYIKALGLERGTGIEAGMDSNRQGLLPIQNEVFSG